MDAQFQIGDILPLAITIVVCAIGVAYGLNVLGDVKDTQGQSDCDALSGYWSTTAQNCQVSAANTTTKVGYVPSTSFNASSDGLVAVAKFSDKLGLIVTVIVAAILIGILVRYLLVR